MAPPNITPDARPWVRRLWMAAGAVALLLGFVGMFLPLLPTTPFVLLAAACFSRGSERWERWLLSHPTFGPMVRDWRAHRCVPRRAKQAAVGMMTVSCGLSWWLMPRLYWLPAACCVPVALWLLSRPSEPRPVTDR